MEDHLYKYFSGTMTPSEKDALFREMEEDSVLKDEFAALQNSVALAGMLEQEGDEGLAAAGLDELKRTALRRKNLHVMWKLMKYAGVILLLVGSWFFSREYTLSMHDEEYTWVEAPKGQRVYLTLADGTAVWLNPCTKLKIPNVFDAKQRMVELEGEGFFKVTKSSDIPFIVKTERYNIRVMGTEFNVFAYPGSKDFEAELVTGAVYVYGDSHPQQGVYLKPDEKVIEVNGRLHVVASKYKQQRLQSEGLYEFEDQSFEELLKRLELWYDVKFVVKNPAILKEKYIGKFRQSDKVDNILQAIKEVGKFQYRILSDKEIEIF